MRCHPADCVPPTFIFTPTKVLVRVPRANPELGFCHCLCAGCVRYQELGSPNYDPGPHCRLGYCYAWDALGEP